MKRNSEGLTMIEVLVALSLFGICLAVFGRIIDGYLRLGRLSLDKGLLASRLQCLEQIKSEVQLAMSLELVDPIEGSSSEVKLVRPDPRVNAFSAAGWSPMESSRVLEVTYSLDDKDRLMRQVKGADPLVVAGDVEGLSFRRSNSRTLEVSAKFKQGGMIRKEIYLWIAKATVL